MTGLVEIDDSLPDGPLSWELAVRLLVFFGLPTRTKLSVVIFGSGEVGTLRQWDVRVRMACGFEPGGRYRYTVQPFELVGAQELRALGSLISDLRGRCVEHRRKHAAGIEHGPLAQVPPQHLNPAFKPDTFSWKTPLPPVVFKPPLEFLLPPGPLVNGNIDWDQMKAAMDADVPTVASGPTSHGFEALGQAFDAAIEKLTPRRPPAPQEENDHED